MMAQQYLAKLDEILYQKSALSPYFEKIEEKCKVKRTYLALGVLAFLLVYIVFGYGGDLICNVMGFVFPAYKSIKAIESDSKLDDTQWLTYWVVYGSFMIVDFFADMILSWFPFYFLAKLAFLGWCMAPYEWNGSTFIYMRILRPFVQKHEAQIDAYLDKGVQGLKEAGQDAYNAANTAASEELAKAATVEMQRQLEESLKGDDDKKDE